MNVAHFIEPFQADYLVQAYVDENVDLLEDCIWCSPCLIVIDLTFELKIHSWIVYLIRPICQMILGASQRIGLIKRCFESGSEKNYKDFMNQ